MNRRLVLRIAVVLLLGCAVGALYFTPLREYMTREHVRELVAQLRGVWYGPIIFIVTYAIGCVVAVPATVFILSAGVIWGWQLGGTYSFLGGLLGATLSLLVGRFVGEGLLERFGKLGRAVAKQVDHAGFRSLLILRLIPLFPFAVMNYGCGVAGVRLLPFIAATAVGLAPSNYIVSYCSDALFNGTMSEKDALRTLFTVAAALIALVLIPTIVKRLFGAPVVVDDGGERA
jgi:uncharacterized membrane protein YdjX (TVP38/TMEM64 family)